MQIEGVGYPVRIALEGLGDGILDGWQRDCGY